MTTIDYQPTPAAQNLTRERAVAALQHLRAAAVVASVVGQIGSHEPGRLLLEAIADAVSVCSGLAGEPLRPEWSESLPNDGRHEFTLSGDCDGSDVRYYARTPRLVVEAGVWRPTTEDAFTNARFPEDGA
ncbi:hypothetical protein [Curtobacterium sp. PsM8]|uniref:hypothetical protein n=1 Tax=Curtobacterium sp. PsM8 TaxID=3030532 RepID=UPI00263B9043|nr:hypothetical protein [Curtobacterium sp. PsM8]MDN4648143.1 hypothetical protein [Curtobacterium sp. PsM8]